jgi:hypothetical protein
MPDSGIHDLLGEDAAMTTFRHAAHDSAMFAAMLGASALALLAARGAADAVMYLGSLIMR